ncbi:MAG: 30S ribosomal protein S6 [Candidatus Sumerlaeia bacterium]|nr:30S ribosomal protein S6 [Candidatus Sumerlaeia bacterium]
MLNYEAVVVYDSSLDDEKVHQQLEELKKFIADRKGKILNVDEWGRRRLAYPIRKRENGYYVVVSFSLEDTEILPALDRSLRLNDAVLRHMVVKVKPAKKSVKPTPSATEQPVATTADTSTETMVSSSPTESRTSSPEPSSAESSTTEEIKNG